jgi:triacylglycerol lipase
MEKEACTDIETCVLQNIEDEPIFLCDKETSAEVYIIYDRKQKTVYITFRGTDDLKDWAYNLDINMEEITITSPLLMDTKVKPLVHSGFLTKFKALSSKIETSLDAFDFSTMVISGHSLGGALATIGSIHFQLMYPSVSITLYVFGSPRCGNKEFTKLVEEKIDKYCRIVNETDPVNELPFCKDFHHIKNCLTIKGNGTARLSDKDTPWSKRLISMLMALDIGDHLLFSGYLTNLKKFL